MSDWVLRLLGLGPVEGASFERPAIHFANLKTPFHGLLFLLAAAAGAWVIWWFYQREPDYCPLRRRRILAALRFGGFLVLLLVIAGPVIEVFMKSYERARVVVLVDTSLSMARTDRYKRPEDRLVAAHALNAVPLSERDPARIPATADATLNTSDRMAIVRGMLDHPNLRPLSKLADRYNVEVFSFSSAETLKPLNAANATNSALLNGVVADGATTELGGTLRKVYREMRGHHLAGIVLISDGANNAGEDPIQAAQDAPAPIYPIGIGVPESQDLAISEVFVDSKIFVDDSAPVIVRLRQRGFSGQGARLTVTAFPNVGGTADGPGEELAAQDVLIKDSGEQTEVLRVKPKKVGKYIFRVEAKPVSTAIEDAEPANNVRERAVEVIEDKLNVLLVEGEPRWEFRYLKNALLRDRRASVKILLRVPDLNELAVAGSPYLKEFPKGDELNKYHAIVFGNVPNDGFLADVDMDNLRKFVQDQGGGIWFIAGKNHFPDAYRDTKMDLLIPVEFERSAEVTAEDEQQSPLTEPFRAALTPDGRTHSLTRLDTGGADAGDEQNAALWGLLPEMYWHHRAIRPKLGATTLLAYSSEREPLGNQRGTPAPLLVVSQVGRGRVLYQAFADLWRMRYPLELGPDALERFHAHAIQYLGLPKLLGRTSRVEISTDRPEYGLGEKVRITVRVLGGEMDGARDGKLTAVVSDDRAGSGKPVDLVAEPGQRGVFSGTFEPQALANYQAVVYNPGSDPEGPPEEAASADFRVVKRQIEDEEPEMRRELLEAVAKASSRSGSATPHLLLANQAGDLNIDCPQRIKEERREKTLWDSPLVLLLFTLFMGAEWLLRKRSDLL